MAFNTNEQQLIRWGVQNGKSKDEITQALVMMRAGVQPQPPQQPQPNSTGKDLAIGFAKGAGSSLKLAQDVVAGGVGALVNPIAAPVINKGLTTVKDSFQDAVGLTDENLKADNTTQLIGKWLEIGAEIATPLAAGRVASLGLSAARKSGDVLADTTKGALSKGKSWLVSDAPLSVENVLKETPTQRFDQYVDIAKKAGENNKNITPLEFAGKRAQEALDQLNRKASTIGENKSAIINGAAGRTPVGNIVVKYRQQLQNAIARKTTVEGDQRVYKDVLSEAQKLGDNPTAADVDRFIDFVQDRIYTARRDLTVPVTDDIQNTLRPITGQLNEALKTKLPDSYRTLNQQYSDLVEIRNELNTKLGLEGEKGGALMKRVFSPSDANTKELFADVLDVTGIDLVDEATLARYVMDTLGDARQKSMLEQLKLLNDAGSPSGIMQFVDKARQLIDTPQARLEKARKLTKPDASSAFGAAASFQPDENGNVNISPEDAAIGAAGAFLGVKGLKATELKTKRAELMQKVAATSNKVLKAQYMKAVRAIDELLR